MPNPSLSFIMMVMETQNQSQWRENLLWICNRIQGNLSFLGHPDPRGIESDNQPVTDLLNRNRIPYPGVHPIRVREHDPSRGGVLCLNQNFSSSPY